MTIGKEARDEFPGAPSLSLRTPEIKNSTEDIFRSGFSSKSSSSRSGSSCGTNSQSSFKAESQQTGRKQRRCWSPELHRRFVCALQQLGGAQGSNLIDKLAMFFEILDELLLRWWFISIDYISIWFVFAYVLCNLDPNCVKFWLDKEIQTSLCCNSDCALWFAAATPKQIRELMQVDGLTNDEVKSHLQVHFSHTFASLIIFITTMNWWLSFLIRNIGFTRGEFLLGWTPPPPLNPVLREVAYGRPKNYAGSPRSPAIPIRAHLKALIT